MQAPSSTPSPTPTPRSPPTPSPTPSPTPRPPPTSNNSRTIYIVTIAFLSVLVVGFAFWALYAQSGFSSRQATISENPYSIRFACFDGKQKEAYLLTREEDPQRTAYQTLNYCINNAPPSAFTSALEHCDLTPEGQNKLVEFFAWYPSNYIDTCGNGWKGADVRTASATQPIPGQDAVDPRVNRENEGNPNNSLTLNGLNDPTATYAYCCATKTQGFIDKLRATPEALAGYEKIRALLPSDPCKTGEEAAYIREYPRYEFANDPRAARRYASFY